MTPTPHPSLDEQGQSPEQVVRLLVRLAEALAPLHRLRPPAVLGHVAARVQGLVPLDGGAPRDDVRTLALLWNDLLNRAGLSPKERPPAHAELLAACVGGANQPADAAELAARLTALLPIEAAAPVKEKEADTGWRGRGRRSREVADLLDKIGTKDPELPKQVTNSIGMKFVLVPAGTFLMGSPPTEVGRRDNEGPTHEVVLARPFHLGVYPVTQEQYEKVMGTNPARFRATVGGGPDHPVENVSWDDVTLFLSKLSDLPAEKEASRSYRRPSEAEWEYACRAGTSTPFAYGASLSARQANFDGNYPYGDAPRGPSLKRTSPVGSYPANNFGLHDMHGNVWEWCGDWFADDYYKVSSRQEPWGPSEGPFRVLRGGSWRNQALTCRSAYRNALAPNQRQPFIGFRVLLVLGVPKGQGAGG